MVLSQTEEERKKILADLKKIQIKDFYGLLKAMRGKPVTIRLLDAPLHEFLPHNETEKKEYLDYAKNCGIKMTKAALEAQMIALSESNPMLGHRGCRIAISHPEIYEMQVSALFEAACKLSKEKIKVFPEVMIPIIMNAAELKTLIYGKKIEGYTYTGLAEIAQEVCKKNKVTNLKYSFGTMIELPCAALSSAEIARYAEFFSFGTNDLTQTCLGLSRDDFTSFMPDYTMLDLIDGNPFSVLDSRVKELIELSTKRGTEARPDLSVGLCGEHGARPENIQFCMNAGLHYVSCSPYSVPIALLAVAQENLKKEG
jgi:pyruvate,orthophosphate dikinase